MTIRLEKPWLPFTEENIAAVPAHLGVYQLGNEAGEIIFIGVAGGRSLFGLQGELAAHLEDSKAVSYRLEVNTAYTTRYRELLMVHNADFGTLPADNQEADAVGLGTLSPG